MSRGNHNLQCEDCDENAIPSFVGAIAVEGGKVSATGNSDELLRLADPMTTVIDAKGRPYGVL
jgi:hypothetical protein